MSDKELLRHYYCQNNVIIPLERRERREEEERRARVLGTIENTVTCDIKQCHSIYINISKKGMMSTFVLPHHLAAFFLARYDIPLFPPLRVGFFSFEECP